MCYVIPLPVLFYYYFIFYLGQFAAEHVAFLVAVDSTDLGSTGYTSRPWYWFLEYGLFDLGPTTFRIPRGLICFEEFPGRWECEACYQAHTFFLFLRAAPIKAASSLDCSLR